MNRTKIYMSKQNLLALREVLQFKLDYMFKASPQDKADRHLFKQLFNIVLESLQYVYPEYGEDRACCIRVTDEQLALLTRLKQNWNK